MTMIPSLCAVTLVVVLTAVPASISGQTKDSSTLVFPVQTEGEFIVKDFHFKSGEVLPERSDESCRPLKVNS